MSKDIKSFEYKTSGNKILVFYSNGTYTTSSGATSLWELDADGKLYYKHAGMTKFAATFSDEYKKVAGLLINWLAELTLLE